MLIFLLNMIYYSLIHITCESGWFWLVKSDPLITEAFSHTVDRVNNWEKLWSKEFPDKMCYT